MVRHRRTRLYCIGFLMAIELLLAFSALGYISTGTVSITLVGSTVVVGAMLLSPVGSGILGLLFGASSIWVALCGNTAGWDVLFNPSLSGNVLNSHLLAIGCRTLWGVLAGLVFYFIRKKKLYSKSNVVIGAFISMLLYSGIMAVGMKLLFPNVVTYADINVLVIQEAVSYAVAVASVLFVYIWFESEDMKAFFRRVEARDFAIERSAKSATIKTVVVSLVTSVVIIALFYNLYYKGIDSIRVTDATMIETEVFNFKNLFYQFGIGFAAVFFILNIVTQYFVSVSKDESEKYRALVDIMPGGLIELESRDDNVTVEFISKGIGEMLQYSEEETSAYPPQDVDLAKLIYFEDLFLFKYRIREAKNGEIIRLTQRLRQKDGEYRYVLLKAVVTKHGDKSKTVRCVYQDIHEMKTHEMRLEHLYAESIALRDAVADEVSGVYRFNVTRNKCVESVNDKDKKKNVYEGVVDDFFKDELVRAADNDAKNHFKQVFTRSNIISEFINGTTMLKGELRLTLEDGRCKWYEISMHLMKNPNSGDVEGFYYRTDIDIKKKLESIVDTILQTDYELLATLDINSGRFDVYNLSAQEISTLPAGTNKYDDWLFYAFAKARVSKDEQEDLYSRFKLESIVNGLNSQAVYTISYPFRDEKGNDICKKWQFTYLDRAEKLILFSRIDVTSIYLEQLERQRELNVALNQAEHANAAKSDFLSRMSHDIRTPMNAILGLTQILKDELTENERALGYLDKMSNSGEYLLGLINDVLDMSKIENDKVEIFAKPNYMKRSLESVVGIAQNQAARKDIEFVYENSLKDEVVLFDEMRYRQIMINLLSNAIKYTNACGKVEFIVSEIDRRDKWTIYRFVIRDNGCGMTTEFQKTLFEPFSRDSKEESTGVFGTGLGLAIVKNLVTLMDGKISFTSKENVGTEFTVDFRVFFPENDETVATEDAGEGTEADFEKLRGKRLLLVEDNEINAEIAMLMLDKFGLDVDNAHNGREAVYMVCEGPDEYDGILMDIQMPVMDGLEATRNIRASEREYCKNVPIIAMTANAFATDVENSIMAGMDAHLSKPIVKEELIKYLIKYLVKRQ